MAKFNVTTNATEEGLWRQTCSMKGLSPLSLNVPMFSYSWTKLENSRWKKLKNSIYVVYIIFFTCGQDPPCASDFILHILLLRTGSSPKPASCKTYVAKIIHPLLCQITGCNTLTSNVSKLHIFSVKLSCNGRWRIRSVLWKLLIDGNFACKYLKK